jgi:8-oxo-dGTP diphosphatase
VAEGLARGERETTAQVVVTGDEVRAAGGLVTRAAPEGGVEVLVVHRPRYDDWSLPKGKLDAGETFEAAALREVHEETGLRCELGAPLDDVRYEDRHGRPKVVRYWQMTPVVDTGDFEPNDEVDEVRWLHPEGALALLTYAHDRGLVGRLAGPGRA